MAAKILIVDDENDVLTFFSAVLGENGYETATARNGTEALDELRTFVPDLVLLDITMPETSGVRVYKEMRRSPRLAHVPIVIVTGVPHEFKAFISSRRTAPPPDGYLEKPVSADQVLAEVRRVLPAGRAAVS